jgi:hypothetical protein
LIEVRSAPQGSADLIEALQAAGISIRCGQTITSAKGGIDGV